MKEITKWSLMAAALVAVGVCTRQCAAPTRMAAPITFIGALDASASNRGALPASTLEMADLASSLPVGSSTTLYRIDARVQEIYNGSAPGFAEEFASHITPRLKEVAREDNTYIHLLSRAITTRLKGASEPIVVVIDSDWFCEGMTVADHKEVQEQVKHWASDKRVACIIACHVSPKRMEAVRADLSGAGQKAIVTPDEVPADLISRMVREVTK